jgi:hypothetical protein
VDVKCHFIRRCETERVVQVLKVHTLENRADITSLLATRGRCIATMCPMTSSDGCRQPLFHSFPLPASQGRTHLRICEDCIACLCCSLTRVTGSVHAA